MKRRLLDRGWWYGLPISLRKLLLFLVGSVEWCIAIHPNIQSQTVLPCQVNVLYMYLVFEHLQQRTLIRTNTSRSGDYLRDAAATPFVPPDIGLKVFIRFAEGSSGLAGCGRGGVLLCGLRPG